jgi:hypothetical protein
MGDNMPADLRHDRMTSRIRLTCWPETKDGLDHPSGWGLSPSPKRKPCTWPLGACRRSGSCGSSASSTA